MRQKITSIFVLIFLLLVLPLLLLLVKNLQQYLGRAAFLPANIVVDAGKATGPFNSPLRALAQGGEIEKNGQPVFFSEVIPQLTLLSPKYIRIDHLYDFYNVVSKNADGSLSFNWIYLDKMVDDILKTGALPFFSLSYMPPAIAQNGNIIGPPTSWSDWQNVVRETVKHYSGRNQKNLNNVYYEVWNEPDLFGNWRIGGPKDYQLLYQHAVLGAQKATNINDFKIGGPATTQPLKVWTDDFLTFVERNNLRLDFLSWHRYSFNPQQFNRDIINVNSWLSPHFNFRNVELVISEWGSDSEINPVHDSFFDAIHTLAVGRQLLEKVSLGFSFEIKDGEGPENKKYWGRWGIFTHQKDGTTPKPRYHALLFLENLSGERLALSGEGTDVTGFATKDKGILKTLLVNYKISKDGKQEAVPFSVINLPRGIYSYKESFLLGKTTSKTVKVANGIFSKTLYLPVNQAVILELNKTSDLATFEPGRFGYQNDGALVLDQENPALTFPLNQVLLAGTVEFWLKTNFDGSSLSEQFFFDLPLGNDFRLIAKKDLSGFGNVIKYGLFQKGEDQASVSLNISSWKPGEWHFVSFGWEEGQSGHLKLLLFVDGKSEEKLISNQKVNFVSNLFIGGYKGSLEELRVSSVLRNPRESYLFPQTVDENTLILKHFDGSL